VKDDIPNPYSSTQLPAAFNAILSGHLLVSGGHFCAFFDFQSKIATVPTEIMNAMTANIRTIFWMERLKKLLNIPPPPLPVAPDDDDEDDELPNADEPKFFALEIKSILLLYSI
jgi:hypothetical protein